MLFIPVLLMLLFRKTYPRWWYDWNLQLTRFTNRIAVYFLLMDDRYPSTEDPQAVHLDFPYPDAEHELSRGLPVVKWLLAIPHYAVLFFLSIGALFAGPRSYGRYSSLPVVDRFDVVPIGIEHESAVVAG